MRGERSEGSCGQGVPRVNRTVQTRVLLDAIVSDKTFWNATFAPACKLYGTFKTFEQDLRLLVSTRTMIEVKNLYPFDFSFHLHGMRCSSEWRSLNILRYIFD
jgi:hypothetical protein